MRKWIEMRVWGNEALEALAPGLGRQLQSGPRLIDLPADSSVFDRVFEVLRDAYGDPPGHYSAYLHFRYTKAELCEAEVLRLRVTRAFEPDGEACGTTYDYTAACPCCGAGRLQTSPLHLKLNREWQAWPSLPRTRHFQIARTIADELVVSEVLAERMQGDGITGVSLQLVYGCGARGKETPLWRQLVVTGTAGRTVPPTRFGLGPFREDEADQYRCPHGHVSGLNVLSEVHVARTGWDASDVTATTDLYGVRVGVLVPAPMILISQRLYQLLLETGTKGFEVDVAHLV